MQPAPIHTEAEPLQRGVIRSVVPVIWIITQILAILGMVSFFLLVGTIGGVVMSAWESVKKIDLSQLDYQRVDTWKQHLEIYSSVCTIQTGDAADFLLQKINWLKYEEIPPTHVGKQRWSPGQYSLALDEAKQNGTVEVFVRGFHYPRADQSSRDLTLQIQNGRISTIQELQSGNYFGLNPEREVS